MTRPLTCLTLIAAAGAGLYLYQEKHRAQMVDREINRVVRATEQIRDRAGMMRAEWAMLNEPDRLAQLASQHLTLQNVAPAQFAQLADLGNRLPAVGAPTQPPAPVEAAAPAAIPAPAIAAIMPKPDPVRPPVVASPQPAPKTGPLIAQGSVLPRARPPVRMTAARPPEPEAHPLFAPVVQAFASQMPPQPMRAPSVQQASTFSGSSLGMARTMLAAPVPVAEPGALPAR